MYKMKLGKKGGLLGNLANAIGSVIGTVVAKVSEAVIMAVAVIIIALLSNAIAETISGTTASLGSSGIYTNVEFIQDKYVIYPNNTFSIIINATFSVVPENLEETLKNEINKKLEEEGYSYKAVGVDIEYVKIGDIAYLITSYNCSNGGGHSLQGLSSCPSELNVRVKNIESSTYYDCYDTWVVDDADEIIIPKNPIAQQDVMEEYNCRCKYKTCWDSRYYNFNPSNPYYTLVLYDKNGGPAYYDESKTYTQVYISKANITILGNVSPDSKLTFINGFAFTLYIGGEVEFSSFDEDFDEAIKIIVFKDPQTTYYVGTCIDVDGDGYGVGNACENYDCNDEDSTIYPNAPELCEDMKDNQCPGDPGYGVEDEGCFKPKVYLIEPKGRTVLPGKITLKVSTNRNAICRYSDQNVGYSWMKKFANTGKLEHETTLNLQQIGDYTYYVRCKAV